MKLSTHDKIRIPIAALIGFLALILIITALFPLNYGSTATYASSVALQSSRSNAFAKNALILRDETLSPKERTQARDDIQIALPEFEKQQDVLTRNRDQAVQVKLLVVRPSYLRLVQALRSILAESDTPSAAQISIVNDNSRIYVITMNQCLLVLQQDADNLNFWLVIVQSGLIVAIVACFIGYNLVNRHERKLLGVKGKALEAEIEAIRASIKGGSDAS